MISNTNFKTMLNDGRSYAPPKKANVIRICFYFGAFILLAETINNNILTVVNADKWQQYNAYDTVQPDTSFPDALALQYSSEETSSSLLSRFQSTHKHGSGEPTPPLIHSFGRLESPIDEDNIRNEDNYPMQHEHDSYQRLISPQHVVRAPRSLVQVGPELNLMSPVFNTHPTERTLLSPLQDVSQFSSQLDVNNLDIVEQGSGSGWPDPPFDRADEGTSLNAPALSPSVTFTGPQSTPTLDQMPIQLNTDNSPVLTRRLPKLVATSGSAWQYAIPPDTFQDEDGNLRQLRSSLTLRHLPENQNTTQDNSQPFVKRIHWLQYDQSIQTLYGFPTDNEVGRHEYVLQVSDRWNSSSTELVEITVRRHQSSQAFTHSITIGFEMETSKRRSSMPEVLSDVVKFISEGVFNDPDGNNMVVHSYNISEVSQESSSGQHLKSPLSISWSNSSLPIHPCDLYSIESIFRLLVDDRYITPTWSLQTHGSSDLAPSQVLIKAMGADFRPSSVSIILQGACESRKHPSVIRGLNPLDADPRVRNRIGKMRWKLGQPIMYRIPSDVFVASDGASIANNLSLTLHTIDGKTLEQDPGYSFLEFDQDSQTIFGLPYDLNKHVGQKELLLTARHIGTNQITRDTFVIEIEPQDLTTINNRAFRMSLYFMIRTNSFGPREKVQISRRIISALEIGHLNYDHDQERPEFTVINIKQFTTSSNLDNSATLSDPTNSWKYQDKIFLVGNMNPDSRERNYPDSIDGDGTIFYKFTWTNETIGYRGECPVEVIKENILYALERSMINYIPPHVDQRIDDHGKNDSVRFYERLRAYFEPELDLIHLRFEPLGACMDALELHDVGNSDVADSADKAEDMEPVTEQPISTPLMKSTEISPKIKETSPINSDEYWAIVVLIILVVAIIFVVMMLFMGLHTYRINQEKRFELQLKLAQARQNSMYLSTMVLADQSYVNEMLAQQAGMAKPLYVDERSSRKPVILDTEKQLLTNGNTNVPMYKPTSVHLTGNTVQTMPLRQNTTFTMDSIANLQSPNYIPKTGSNTMIANNQMLTDGRHQSMTLNRRVVGAQNRPIGRQASMSQLSQSQSILTVASVGPQGPFVPNPQAPAPFIYTPMPVFYESAAETVREL